jgi:integrase
MVAKNPASGMQLGKGKRTDPPRESFTDEDLRRLFHTELYLKDQHQNSYSFWVPIIALFTGARIEEICQLHLDDIKQEEGVWVFDITYGDGKKVKTEAGERFVPIHPFLLNDLKIVQYVESLRQKGETRLFPELTLQRDGYSQRVSKWFGRYKRECGIRSSKKVFHSFRHTLIDALKQNGDFNPIMHKELVGHVVDDMTYGRYAEPYKPEKVYEIIKNIKYDVDLSHLIRSRFVSR